MKWVVFFLLILNFALLSFYVASSYMAEQQDAATAETSSPPPYSGPIRILSEQELAAMPKKAPDPATAAPEMHNIESCFEWGNLSAADAAHALAALKGLNLQATVKVLPRKGSSHYWVYIPPLPTLAEAKAKRDEIKALGVNETVLIQDGQWKNAISLGVFKDETLAKKLIYKLHGMGIDNAVKAGRGNDNDQSSYTVRHVSPEQALKLAELKPQFPASELKLIERK